MSNLRTKGFLFSLLAMLIFGWICMIHLLIFVVSSPRFFAWIIMQKLCGPAAPAEARQLARSCLKWAVILLMIVLGVLILVQVFLPTP